MDVFEFYKKEVGLGMFVGKATERVTYKNDKKKEWYNNFYLSGGDIKDTNHLRNELKDIIKKSGVGTPQIILDLGSGAGTPSVILNKIFNESIICLDFSRKGLIQSKIKNKYNSFIQADGYYLPFKKESCDLIFIREFSILNNFNVMEYLQSLKYYLKKRGMIIVIHSSNLTNVEEKGWIHYDYNHFLLWKKLKYSDVKLYYKITVFNLPISKILSSLQLMIVKLLKGRISGEFILFCRK
jgi:ubiquinone/menaquinone biosynthesis C-methylase UbiE